MAQVNKDLIQITGLSVNAPLVVDGGANGSYAVAAHQIKWDNSKFNGYTFGGTSEGLLTAIETAIANKTVDLTGYATVGEVSYQISSYYTGTILPAIESAVDTHADKTDIHITAGERTTWSKAAEDINAFLTGNNIEGAVDTLKEIQNYIDTDGSRAEQMVSDIAAAQTRADSAYYHATDAYTYTIGVGGVADDALAYARNAETEAINAYTYASNVGKVADAAQTRADSAYYHATDAYTYTIGVGAVADTALAYAQQASTDASNAYTYAANVGGVADNAYAKGWAAYSYATTECGNLSNRITELANQGIDTESVNNIIKDYLSDADLTTDISYGIVHTDVPTTKFLTNFSYVRTSGTNDYEFVFTYYEFKMPTAADYWGEYEPSTTEPPIV